MVRVNKFFCLDLSTAGLVIGSMDVFLCLVSIMSFLSPLGTKQVSENAVTVLQAIVSAVVVVGTETRKHQFLLPFLIFYGILLVSFLPISCIAVFEFFKIWVGNGTKPSLFEENELDTFLRTFGLPVLFVAYRAYCYVAIYSLYHQLRQALAWRQVDPHERHDAAETNKNLCTKEMKQAITKTSFHIGAPTFCNSIPDDIRSKEMFSVVDEKFKDYSTENQNSCKPQTS